MAPVGFIGVALCHHVVEWGAEEHTGFWLLTLYRCIAIFLK
jgi:hypothetical protein